MAVGYDRVARDVAFTLETKSPAIFENIFLNNACLLLMGSKGRVKIVKGGNRFDERTHLGQNSNVDLRDKYAEIPTTMQNNFQTAYYGQAVVDGSTVVNLVELDQNAGPEKLDDLAQKLVDELMDTFPNKVADAIMQTTSGAADPTSLIEELPATVFGSQTQTTGGIARSDYPGIADPTAAWQTNYSNSAASLDGAAGIATVTKFIWECSKGGSALNQQPDLGLVTSGVFAKISGAADVLRRYTSNEKMADFGFTNFKILNTTLFADRNVPAKNGLFLNTNYMHMQVLGGPKTKTTRDIKVIGEGSTKVPIQISEPIRAYNKLEYSILAYLVFNITMGGLRQHGRMDNLTEA